MVLVITQVFRYANDQVRRVEITLFGRDNNPIETRFINREVGLRLFDNWDKLTTATRLKFVEVV